MMYKLLFHPQSVKRLNKIHSIDKKRVLRKIDKLAKNPKDKSLDIKKLVNTKASFRLRIGNLRVIYELDSKSMTIYIWEIDYRGNVY